MIDGDYRCTRQMRRPIAASSTPYSASQSSLIFRLGGDIGHITRPFAVDEKNRTTGTLDITSPVKMIQGIQARKSPERLDPGPNPLMVAS